MPAFVKLKGIDGQATDAAHKGWVIIQSMSAPIYRSIVDGARDQQRVQGDTTLGDVVIVRELDKSSTKLQEACAQGKFFDDVEIHFCTTVKNKQEPYLTYKLYNVIITSYNLHANESGMPLPTEQITMNYTKADWCYVVVNPDTGAKEGQVPANYVPGEGQSR
jgi:type VI secretion system secreted protein Hcp